MSGECRRIGRTGFIEDGRSSMLVGKAIHQIAARRRSSKSQYRSPLVGKIHIFYVLLLIIGYCVTNKVLRRGRATVAMREGRSAEQIGNLIFVECVVAGCLFQVSE